MSNKKPDAHRQNEHIVDNKELNIWEALIPVLP